MTIILMASGGALLLNVIATALLASRANHTNPERSIVLWVFIWFAMTTVSFTQIMAFQPPKTSGSNSIDSKGLKFFDVIVEFEIYFSLMKKFFILIIFNRQSHSINRNFIRKQTISRSCSPSFN